MIMKVVFLVTTPLLLYGIWRYLFRKKVMVPFTWKKIVPFLLSFLMIGFFWLLQFMDNGGTWNLSEQDLSDLTETKGILRITRSSKSTDFYMETPDGKKHKVHLHLMSRSGGFVEYEDQPLVLWLKGRFAYQASDGREIIRPLEETNQNVSAHNWNSNLILLYITLLFVFFDCMLIKERMTDEKRTCAHCGALLGHSYGGSRGSEWVEYKFCSVCGRDSAPLMEIRHNEKLNTAEKMGGLLAYAPVFIGFGCIVFFVTKTMGIILLIIFVIMIAAAAWDTRHPMECPNCFEWHVRGDCFCHNCGARLKK